MEFKKGTILRADQIRAGMKITLALEVQERPPVVGYTRLYRGEVRDVTHSGRVAFTVGSVGYVDATMPNRTVTLDEDWPSRRVGWHLIKNTTTNMEFTRYWDGNGWTTNVGSWAAPIAQTPGHWQVLGRLHLERDCLS